MTIEVEVFGNQQVPKHRSNITGYSYSEEATPIAPGDSSGGVGSLSFEALDDEQNVILIFNDDLMLTDSHNGSITGHVNNVSGNNGVASFSGVSSLSRLNIIKTIPAINTTLGSLIEIILNEAGIFSGIDIDSSITNISVVSPTYTGDLWVFLKDLCTAYEIEVALVSDTLRFRPVRQNVLRPVDKTSESWSVGEVNPSQYVEVNYYNYVDNDSFLAYPQGGWSKDVQVYQVDANQTLTIELPLDAYMEYIEQPIIQSTVGRYDSSASVYCVAGNDGLPIVPLEWINNGGSLNAELDSSGQKIIVTLTGANITSKAPFRIGVSSGPSDYYSSLRIIGKGISYEKKTIRQPTGLTVEDTSNIVGITVDNKFINTEAQARDAALRTVVKYAIPNQTYSFDGPNLGDFLTVPGTVVYTHFFEYDDSLPEGELFNQLDSTLSDWDFLTFDARLPTSVVDGVTGQIFGNVAGARVRFRDSWYRVKSATITQDNISVTSEWDNMFSDFNTENASKTFADVNATFDQLSFTDFAIVPMRVS